MAYENNNQDYQKNFVKNSSFQEVFKKEWITNGLDREADKFTEDFGLFLKNQLLTTSQIRNIFGEIKNLQMKIKNSEDFKKEESNFILAKAKLAYADGRNKNSGLAEFRRIFDLAHKEVKDEATFKRFVSFITAMLAYHRAAGGK